MRSPAPGAGLERSTSLRPASSGRSAGSAARKRRFAAARRLAGSSYVAHATQTSASLCEARLILAGLGGLLLRIKSIDSQNSVAFQYCLMYFGALKAHLDWDMTESHSALHF